jgi:hypothetical protein
MGGIHAPFHSIRMSSGSIQTFVSHLPPPHLQMFESQEPLETIDSSGALEFDI